MMTFEEALRNTILAHPQMQMQDVVKFCYQAARGAEHLLSDVDEAERYFTDEFIQLKTDDIDVNGTPETMTEPLSEKVCRVDLRAWKMAGLPKEWLFAMFVRSATVSEDGEAQMRRYLDIAGNTNGLFAPEDWVSFCKEYEEAGMPAVHHSPKYREEYSPAYRIVRNQYASLIPVLFEIRRAQKCGMKPVVIAIEGRAAAGKTTMARCLSEIVGAEVVHMDDFFLPVSMRTAERLAECGGNVHYERVKEEVVDRLKTGEDFSYRIFDCSIMDYNGERKINGNSVVIVEGAYSTHPYFGDFADVRIFCDVGPEEQIRRILERNGRKMAERFQREWIPMEEAYFSSKKYEDFIRFSVVV